MGAKSLKTWELLASNGSYWEEEIGNWEHVESVSVNERMREYEVIRILWENC